MKNIKERLRSTDDRVRRTNISLIGVPETEEVKIVSEAICKQITADNVPDLIKNNKYQIQENKMISRRINKYPQPDTSL